MMHNPTQYQHVVWHVVESSVMLRLRTNRKYDYSYAIHNRKLWLAVNHWLPMWRAVSSVPTSDPDRVMIKMQDIP